jgi:hypothetical protein
MGLIDQLNLCHHHMRNLLDQSNLWSLAIRLQFLHRNPKGLLAVSSENTIIEKEDIMGCRLEEHELWK